VQSVPSIDIPLHTVMELVPKADGTMAETRFIVDVDKAIADATGLLAGSGEGWVASLGLVALLRLGLSGMQPGPGTLWPAGVTGGSVSITLPGT
jgi:hypothetical protein